MCCEIVSCQIDPFSRFPLLFPTLFSFLLVMHSHEPDSLFPRLPLPFATTTVSFRWEKHAWKNPCHVVICLPACNPYTQNSWKSYAATPPSPPSSPLPPLLLTLLNRITLTCYTFPQFTYRIGIPPRKTGMECWRFSSTILISEIERK